MLYSPKRVLLTSFAKGGVIGPLANYFPRNVWESGEDVFQHGGYPYRGTCEEFCGECLERGLVEFVGRYRVAKRDCRFLSYSSYLCHVLIKKNHAFQFFERFHGFQPRLFALPIDKVIRLLLNTTLK